MKRLLAALLTGLCVNLACLALAQEPAELALPVEAKKEVVVNWTLGGQAWDFKAILATYEPVKGVFDPAKNEARWTLQIVKDLEPGTALLHNNTPSTPFKPVLLTADKLVMASDAKVQMTEVSGKMGERIEIYVQLPEREVLDTIKLIRLERRTNVGF